MILYYLGMLFTVYYMILIKVGICFLLKTLVGLVYAFGFIMMIPQLFINYKLKGVS
jgi:hypothetical protein